MSARFKEQGATKGELYDLWLELGQLFAVLSNRDDAAVGAEMLEGILIRLQEKWDD